MPNLIPPAPPPARKPRKRKTIADRRNYIPGQMPSKKGLGGAPTSPVGSTSQAPATQAAAARAALAASSAPSSADLISGYNLARAKILQGMAPQVQGIYSRAQGDLTNTVGGLTEDLRSRLYEAGGGKQAFFDQVDPRIQASYESVPASQAAYNLGAAIPGESLAKQGAAYGAAAAFAPERALQEGSYQLQEAIQKEKVTNADAEKVSASTSKMLGYISDAYGNPILGKNGKPIKLPEAGLTPYQTAQLKLSAARLDSSNILGAARIKQSAANSQATDDRFYNGLTFKSKQQADIARQKHGTIDWTASGKAQVLIAKDGTIVHDKHGRTVKFVKPTTKKAKTVSDQAKIDQQIKDWYDGKQVKTGTTSGTNAAGEKYSQYVTEARGKIGYQVALRKLRKEYGLTLDDATNRLNQHWARGERGRPFVSLQEARKMSSDKRFKKWGITPALLQKARSGGTGSVDALNAAHLIDQILRMHDITL